MEENVHKCVCEYCYLDFFACAPGLLHSEPLFLALDEPRDDWELRRECDAVDDDAGAANRGLALGGLMGSCCAVGC